MQQERAAIDSQTNLIQQIAGRSQNPENPITQIMNRIASVSKNKDLDISNLISKIKRIHTSRKGRK